MNFNEISLKVSNLVKGQFGINLVVTTSIDKKLKKSGSHYKGRVEKVVMIENARLGVSYAGMVQAKADKDFVPMVQNGFTWINSYFKRADKSGKIYLQLNYRKSDVRTSWHTVWKLDGRLATNDEIEDIKANMYASSSSQPSTQKLVGVSDEDATSVVMYDIENVKYIGVNKVDAKMVFSGLIK